MKHPSFTGTLLALEAWFLLNWRFSSEELPPHCGHMHDCRFREASFDTLHFQVSRQTQAEWAPAQLLGSEQLSWRQCIAVI